MTDHPCAALPESGWSIHVWYCRTHQAFFASQSSYLQTDGDTVELLSHDDAQWGPFDSYIAAQHFVERHISARGSFVDWATDDEVTSQFP